MNAPDDRPHSQRTIGLFVLLFAIGSVYLASLGYFLVGGRNFVDAEKLAAATRFAQSTKLAWPATLKFDAKSKWVSALAAGWNRPNPVGVWSSRRNADMLLPALERPARQPVCVSATLRGLKAKAMRHWPMALTVNGQALAPRRELTGPGPFTIQGNVTITPGTLIHIRFAGPPTRISNLISKRSFNTDAVGFMLYSLAITPQCTKP